MLEGKMNEIVQLVEARVALLGERKELRTAALARLEAAPQGSDEHIQAAATLAKREKEVQVSESEVAALSVELIAAARQLERVAGGLLAVQAISPAEG
jgi:hypothetical protein